MEERAAPVAAGEYDHYARLVRRLLRVPVGLVSLVESDRQVFPGMIGLPSPWSEARETPLTHSFCQYVVADEAPLVVGDARVDARLADNLAIRDLDVVAYAGWPLTDHNGQTIGSLCAIDVTPRTWTEEDVDTLRDLAAACSAELAQRDRATATARALRIAQDLGERSRALLALSTLFSRTETLADVATAVVRVTSHELGCVRAGMWLRDPEHTVGLVPTVRGPLEATGSVEMLTFVDDATESWPSATRSAELAMDDTNPLGAVLLEPSMLVFATREEQNDRYPHLAHSRQLGEARAFVPLVLRGRFYGTLALIWPVAREFSDDDRDTIAALAAYTAQAVHRVQLLQERDDVSRVLQRAMLTSLPHSDHLDLAARYRPAHAGEAVGGDWYDAVVMPGGSTHLMIGDVVGHDITAAAVMGQLRSMLRMSAWQSEGPPSHNLERLDLAIRDLHIDTFATVVLARIDRTDDGACTLTWSNAGHPPPLLVAPDGTARFLTSDRGNSPLLGAMPGHPRHDDSCDLPPGSTLLLFTDGLVERRRESLDVGLDRLLTGAARLGDQPADGFLDQLLNHLADPPSDDDIAVLAVRTAPSPG